MNLSCKPKALILWRAIAWAVGDQQILPVQTKSNFFIFIVDKLGDFIFNEFLSNFSQQTT